MRDKIWKINENLVIITVAVFIYSFYTVYKLESEDNHVHSKQNTDIYNSIKIE